VPDDSTEEAAAAIHALSLVGAPVSEERSRRAQAAAALTAGRSLPSLLPTAKDREEFNSMLAATHAACLLARQPLMLPQEARQPGYNMSVGHYERLRTSDEAWMLKFYKQPDEGDEAGGAGQA